ncbi:MAG: hypothetical protein IJN02_05780 [Bacteroidales bacterium]|nr:hypothetical protein [Bacteroidales bacterium]
MKEKEETLEYNGYSCSVKLDKKRWVFWGEILGIEEHIRFEGKGMREFIENFHRTVDYYILMKKGE